MKLQVRFSFKLISNPPSLGRLALVFIKTCKTLDTAVCTFITSLSSVATNRCQSRQNQPVQRHSPGCIPAHMHFQLNQQKMSKTKSINLSRALFENIIVSHIVNIYQTFIFTVLPRVNAHVSTRVGIVLLVKFTVFFVCWKRLTCAHVFFCRVGYFCTRLDF